MHILFQQRNSDQPGQNSDGFRTVISGECLAGRKQLLVQKKKKKIAKQSLFPISSLP